MTRTLTDIYAPIREELEAATDVLTREFRLSDARFVELLRHAASRPGKRIRPALLLLSGRACGAVTDRHIRSAAVVELIHTATLIHDDVIDDAQRRRRGATIKACWGDDVSIMLGDLLLARALELFSACAGPLEQRLLATATRAVCEGELLQLLSRSEGPLGEEGYLQIISKKTGALCAAACSLGAAMAGGDGAVVDGFGEFGRCVGVALQIADDCLDIRGDEEIVGKTLGLDVLGGKLTLPLIYVRERSEQSVRGELDQLLARPPGEARREQLAELLTRCGAFDYCECCARRFIDQGAAAIGFLDQQPARDALLALADFVVRRER